MIDFEICCVVFFENQHFCFFGTPYCIYIFNYSFFLILKFFKSLKIFFKTVQYVILIKTLKIHKK